MCEIKAKSPKTQRNRAVIIKTHKNPKKANININYNEIGRKIRRYFIETESRYRSLVNTKNKRIGEVEKKVIESMISVIKSFDLFT